MEHLLLTEHGGNEPYIAYLYNQLLPAAMERGGTGELCFCGGRALIRLCAERGLKARAADAVAEVVCIGYKSRFLAERLAVSMPRRERRLMIAALIAADLKTDAAYVKTLLPAGEELAVDGLWHFRLAALKEKWARIVRYIPASFGVADLKKFCAYLAGESSAKIYLKGSVVYGEDFLPRRKSRLMGEEDAATEIVLSDAGLILCLGDVENGVGDFLQKYYAERAIFS